MNGTPDLEALLLTETEIALLYEALVEFARQIDAAGQPGDFLQSPLFPIWQKLLRLWEGERAPFLDD